MSPRNIHVKPSGLLSTDAKAERDRRMEMAIKRLPSFTAAAPLGDAGLAPAPSPDFQDAPGALIAQRLDPQLIVRSRFANRHETNFSGEEFAALREEIRNAGGNLQPIKVRPLATPTSAKPGTVAPRYELVFGHRRHEACRLEGLPVLALVEPMNDQQLFVEMDRENRARKNLTAWEQGCVYQRALDAGLFPSQRGLATALGVDHSALAKAIAIAKLPPCVVEAFASPLHIQFRWAQPLTNAYAEDAAGVTARAAQARQDKTIKPKQVFDLLMGQAGQAELAGKPKPIQVEHNGKRAQVSQSDKGETLVTIAPGGVSAQRLQALAAVIAQFLAQPSAE